MVLRGLLGATVGYLTQIADVRVDVAYLLFLEESRYCSEYTSMKLLAPTQRKVSFYE
jgi:hypothetical protein